MIHERVIVITATNIGDQQVPEVTDNAQFVTHGRIYENTVIKTDPVQKISILITCQFGSMNFHNIAVAEFVESVANWFTMDKTGPGKTVHTFLLPGLILAQLLLLGKVKGSLVHPQQYQNFLAHGGGIQFQVGAAGTVGFTGFPNPVSASVGSYPALPYAPPQISPYPNYVTTPNTWNNGWWKLPGLPANNELTPSIQSWDTSYSVPCGEYTIHPLVVANIRYSSYQSYTSDQFQQSFGPKTGDTSKTFVDNAREVHGRSFVSPSAIFNQVSQPSTPPSSCSWNFKAFGGSCKLKFTCTQFQLPALFRCRENYVNVKDSVGLNMEFCGSRRPRGSYTSASDSMQIYFHSDAPAALPAAFDCNVLCTVEQYQSDVAVAGAASTLYSFPSNSSASATVAEAIPQPTYTITNLTSPVLNKIVTAGLTPPKTPESADSSSNTNPKLRYLDCKCGVRNESFSYPLSRIVGGTETVEGEFPWTAALVRTTEPTRRPHCGATLINDRWLVTAAHCVAPKGRASRENQSDRNTTAAAADHPHGKRIKPPIEVLLNPHNLTMGSYNNKITRATINRILVHSNYNPATHDYDIALLRLSKPILSQTQRRQNENNKEAGRKLSSWTLLNNAIIENSIKRSFFGRESKYRFVESYTETGSQMIPICLPKPRQRSFDGTQAIVTGFGRLREGGPPSETLMQTRVQIFNQSLCTELYDKTNLTVTQQMVCAGRLSGHMDSCGGDSGGPLLVQSADGDDTATAQKKHVLAGIVSWGRGCGQPNLPGVYTNVAKFVDWIYTNTYTDSNWCTD